MNGEKIQVREGWWRQRCGNVVRIERAYWSYKFLWRCSDDNYFCEDGKWHPNADHPRDLVEFLGKNITITAAD